MTKGEKREERPRVEEKYKALVETAGDPIFTLDLLGRFTFVNPAAERISGYSEDELLGKHFRELLPAKYIPACLNVFQKALRGQPTPPIEIEMITKQGQRVPLELLGRPVKRGRRVVEIIGIGRDITERKRVEQALRESEERLGAFMDSAPDAFALFDSELNLVEMNKAASEMLPAGVKKEDVIGKNILDIAPGLKETGRYDRYLKVIKTGEPFFIDDVVPVPKFVGDRHLAVKVFKVGDGLGMITTDITERKHAEEALQESKELFEKTFISQRDAIFLLDAKSPPTIMDCNPRAIAVFGYTREEMLGRTTAFLHFDEATLKEFQEQLYPAIEERGFLHLHEFKMRRKDGKVFPSEHSVVPLEDEQRKRIGWVSVVRDITERKRAEEALRESEERYRSIVENSHAGILIVDDAYRFIYVNDELCRILGYPREEIVGQDFRRFLDDESKQLVADRYIRRQKGEEVPSRYEFNIVRKDGEKRRVEISSTLIKDPAGKVKTVAQILDITERKRAEEALRESEERFRTIVETAPSVLLVCDAEGNNMYVSPNCEEITGYTQEELLGRMVWWVHEDDTLGVKEIYDRTFREGVGCKGLEYKAVKKNGELWYGSSSWEPFKDAEGKLQGVVFQTVDITERKRAEEALKRRATQLATLGEAGRQITSVLELDELLHQIVNLLEDTLGYRYAYIFLLDKDSNELVLRAGAGLGRVLEGTRIGVEARSINTCVARTAKPLLANDVAKEPMYLLMEEVADTKSELAVPIKVKDEVVGTLDVQSTELNAFDESDLFTLQTLADQAAIAIENAHLYEERGRKAEELAALYGVSLDVAAQLDLDTLLKTILLRATGLLRANAGGLYLYDSERQELELIVHQGLSKDYTGSRLALGEGACGKVALSKEPLVVKDYTNWEGRSPHFDEEPTFNVLAVPIKRGDTLLGALYVDDPDVERRFGEGDIHLATLFANQAAIAIENAKIFKAEQRKATQLAVINEVSKKAISILDLHEMLKGSASSICSGFDYYNVALFLVDKERHEAVIEAVAGGFEHYVPGEYRQSLDQGIIGWVIRTGRSWLANDVSQDPYFITGFLEEILTKSELCVPIKLGGEVIGALDIQSIHLNAFDATDVTAMETLSGQIGVAIQNARLYEETQKRLAETTILHRVAEVINSTLDLKEVFQRVVEELSQTFGYRLVDIYLLEEDGLRLQANVGYDDKTTIELIPLERGVVGRVGRTGQPAFIRDVTRDSDYIPAYPEIKSEICVPIVSGEKLLGTLNVECDEKRPLMDDDLQLLSTLSSHIGVAIENARLYEQEQRLGTQRKTIAEVGRTIAAILDLDTLLSRVVDLIAQNFGYYRVHIFQVDQDSGDAVHKAATGAAADIIAEQGLRLKIGEEGLVGWVAQHGEPLLVNDVSQDPRYYAHPDLPGTRSELDIPIRIGDRVIGVLDVQSTELNAFDEGDLETLQTLADQLAVAMENAHLYEETQQLAITDGLTGLYNLRYFYETLEKEIQRSERYHRLVSLIILDIDDFKGYNDLHGHLAGDDLLKELAQLMSKITRQTDTLARYGGEEFVIILPETETEGAGFLAERLQEEVRGHRFSIQNGQTIGRITISLGVATYPHHADSAKALVDAADKALLRAKQAGKNRLSVCREELTELEPR